MNEVWIYNIFSNVVIEAAFIVLIALLSLLFLLLMLASKRAIGKMGNFLGIVVALGVGSFLVVTNFNIDQSVKSYDAKYYISKNVPVTRYSLEDKQFETKDGRVIKNAKVITTTTIKTKKPKVKLKEYKLKKKWYGMHGVKKTSYYAYVLQPAKKVETVKD